MVLETLQVDHVSKRWSTNAFALADVSFSAHSGTISAFIGPSGSGKSTLLRVIAGLSRYDSGSINNPFGQPGMVFQEPSLWPHLSLLANVMLPLQIVHLVSRRDAEEQATEVLNSWGLKERLHAMPAELSGGQQQRGSLARTLVTKPKVLCLDEVTSALDPEISDDIMQRLLSLKESEKPIILMATHELGFARDCADQIIFMEAGKIRAAGPAREVLASATDERIRRFVHAARLHP